MEMNAIIPLSRKLTAHGYKKATSMSKTTNKMATTLCDCVNMKKDADDKTKEACKEMEQEWKDKYEKANDDEKKKMMDEIMACEGK